MGFMEEVSAFTKGVGQKAKGNYDIVTMNNKISSLSKEIRGIYFQLGEQYYAAHKDDPEEGLVSLVNQIKDLEAQIADIQRQIENTKAVTASVQFSAAPTVNAQAAPTVNAQAAPTAYTQTAPTVNAQAAPTAYAQTAPGASVPPGVGSNGFCRNCGAPLPPESLFCVKCGTKINAN